MSMVKKFRDSTAALSVCLSVCVSCNVPGEAADSVSASPEPSVALFEQALEEIAVDERAAMPPQLRSVVHERLGVRDVERVLHAVVSVEVPGEASAGSEETYDSWTDDEIRGPAGSPFDVSPEMWSAILGAEVTVRGSVSEADGSELTRVQALILRELPPRQPEAAEPLPPRVARNREIEARNENGTLSVYVTSAEVPEIAPADITVLAAVSNYADVVAREDVRMRSYLGAASEAFAARLSGLSGCEVVLSSQIAVAVTLECTDEGLDGLIESAGERQVREISVDTRTEVAGMRGDDYRSDLGAQLRLYLTRDDSGTLCHAGGGTRECHDGHASSRGSTAPIRVALIDQVGFHKAWELESLLDYAGSGAPSRVVSRSYCNSTGCSTDTTTSGPVGGHGARAMIPAFQHILQGQSPTYTTLASQEDRSRGAYETELVLFRDNGSTSALANAIESAAQTSGSAKADVIVISEGVTGIAADCENTDGNHSSVRDAIDYAHAQGAVVVIGAGNHVQAYSDACAVNDMATADNAFVVGAFGDDEDVAKNGRAATPIEDWEYDTQPLMGWHYSRLTDATNCADPDGNDSCWRSSHGGAGLRVGGSLRAGARSRVDLVAPSGMELYERIESNGTSSWNAFTCCGTSQAAPNFAAGLSSFLDYVAVNSYSVSRNPLLIQASVLLQADGTRGAENPGAGPTSTYVEMDNTWGAGRYKSRRFDADGMNSPANWGWRTDYVYSNENTLADSLWILATNGPFNADVDEFAVAVVWDEPYITPSDTTKNAADIIVEVVTTATSGGTCSTPTTGTAITTITGDVSYDTQKIIRIQGASSLHGKCVWTRIRSYGMSSVGGYERRLVATSTFYEDRDNEPSDLAPDIE